MWQGSPLCTCCAFTCPAADVVKPIATILVCTQVKPFTEGLKLNPEADAEALAHAGMLVPNSPQARVKQEVDTTATVAIPVGDAQAASVQSLDAAARALEPDSLLSLSSKTQSGPALLNGHATPELLTSIGQPLSAMRVAQPEAALANDGLKASAGARLGNIQSVPQALGDREVHSVSVPIFGQESTAGSSGQAQRASADHVAVPPAGSGSTMGSSGQARRAPADQAGSKAPPSVPISLPSGSPYKEKIGSSDTAGMHGASELGEQSHGDRATKRQKVGVDEALAAAAERHSPQALGELHSSAAHGAIQEQNTGQSLSPVQAAMHAEVRRSISPRLTTKDGSPSTAAQIRSGATPSRVKVPMQPVSGPA